MSPTDSVQPDPIFASPFRPRSDTIRTYSHKRGSNANTRSLPQLKPQTPPTRPRPRLSQTGLSLEFSPPGGTLVPDDHDPNAQDLNISDTLDENTGEPEQETPETDIPTHAVDNYEVVYNPDESDIDCMYHLTSRKSWIYSRTPLLTSPCPTSSPRHPCCSPSNSDIRL